MDVKMVAAFFKPSNLTSVLLFLDNFITVCNSNNIQKTAPMWLIPHFIREAAKVVLPDLVETYYKTEHQKCTLRKYCEVSKYWSKKCAIEEFISEAKTKSVDFKKLFRMTDARYSEFFCNKVLCGRLYDMSTIKGIFFENLYWSVPYSMRTYLRSHKLATLRSLVRHTTTLHKL